MSERIILLGFLLFVVVILPILLVRDYRHRKKVRKILRFYRERKNEDITAEESEKLDSSSGTQGWGMNNSPFRNRKSGLSWGGGNIKASDATRGSRRKFMKRG